MSEEIDKHILRYESLCLFLALSFFSLSFFFFSFFFLCLTRMQKV